MLLASTLLLPAAVAQEASAPPDAALPDAASAGAAASGSMLRMRTPVPSPSNTAVLAFEQREGDVNELYLYLPAVGQAVPVRTGVGVPVADPFPAMFGEAQETPIFRRYTGQIAWRPVLDLQRRQWFAFVGPGAGGADIYLSYVDADGQLAETMLQIPHGGLDMHPSWDPDGTALVFVASATEGADLVVAHDVDTAIHERSVAPIRLQRVMTPTEVEAHPVWSPSGEYIAYQMRYRIQNTPNIGIGLIHVEDLRLREIPQVINLTDRLQVYNEYRPSWSPDGEAVAYFVTQYQDAPPDTASAPDAASAAAFDIGIVSVVRALRTGRVIQGELLRGTEPRIALGVVPHSQRGPAWVKTLETLGVLYVSDDAEMAQPLYVADFTAWRQQQRNFARSLAGLVDTSWHRDPFERAGTLAFVAEVGGVERVERMRYPEPIGERTIRIEDISRTKATRRAALYPGLGATYRGQRDKGVVGITSASVALASTAYVTQQLFDAANELDDIQADRRRAADATGATPGSAEWQQVFNRHRFEEKKATKDRQDGLRQLVFAHVGLVAGLWTVSILESYLGTTERVPVQIAGDTYVVEPPAITLSLHDGAPAVGVRVGIRW